VTVRRFAYHAWPWVGLIVGLAFLYLPVLTTALFSLNDSSVAGFPFRGLTFHWYAQLWQDPLFKSALGFSLRIASISTAIAVVIGSTAAIGMSRLSGRRAAVLNAFYVLPLLVPALVLAVAMASAFRLLNIGLTSWTIVAGHVVVSAPLIYLLVSARLQHFDWSLPSAARVLGASPLQAFWKITAPLVAPAVLGGAILAFAISMDNFVLSLFLTGTQSTLPLLIWSRMRAFFDPTVNAMATLFIAFTLVAAILAERLVRLPGIRER
jgi:spermidine/putrescine transport system permease protein